MALKSQNDNGFKFTELDPLTGIAAAPGKSCGSCTACCSVMPVKEIGLKAYTRCPKLRGFPDMRPGCGIYATRPFSCRSWSCGWLASDLPDEVRPDRCGVVIDPMPDTIRADGVETVAVQFWALPGFEDSWQRDPVLGLIVGVVESGMAVVWRHPPDAAGRNWARGFLRDPKTGVYSHSELFEERHDHGLGDDAARMRRAQELLRHT